MLVSGITKSNFVFVDLSTSGIISFWLWFSPKSRPILTICTIQTCFESILVENRPSCTFRSLNLKPVFCMSGTKLINSSQLFRVNNLINTSRMLLRTRNLGCCKQSPIPSLGLSNASKYNLTGGNATEILHQSLLLIYILGEVRFSQYL